MTIGAMAILIASSATAGMPVAQQNAMVRKYCAVCHTDAVPNGGLSLQHFDAADPDPGLSAMLVSKLRGKALGASGQPLPDRATQDALDAALAAEAVGAERWVTRTNAGTITASIVRGVPAPNGEEPNLYRLTVSCRADNKSGTIQLAWSPGVPSNGQIMAVAVDGQTPHGYKVEGKEMMGNGQAGTSGPGAIELKETLPVESLSVRNLFGAQGVVFPFAELDPQMRRSLIPCFGDSTGHR